MPNKDARVRAAKLVAKLTTSNEGRRYLEHNGYKSGQAVVVAAYEETIRDVMNRVHSHTPPVTVALVKDGNDELYMFSIVPGASSGTGATSASPESTIGMLYESANQQASKNESFKITEWNSAVAHAMPSARELLAL